MKIMLYNHGWEKQQTLRPKGSRPKRGSGRQKNPPKEILQRVKRTISNEYERQKKQIKRKTILNYKFKLLLNFRIGVSSVIIA